MDGNKSIFENSLTDLNQFLNPNRFFQANRKPLVHINAILKIGNYFNRRLVVQLRPDNLEVIISRERIQDFKE